MKKSSLFLMSISVAALLSLSACGTAPTDQEPLSPSATRPAAVSSGVSTPAPTAPQTVAEAPPNAREQFGDRRESLSTTERIFNNNKNDGFSAARYAKSLREAGNVSKAESILSGFAKKADQPTLVYTEMAALKLEQTKFAEAENFAHQAIKIAEANYRAWHILGISLDSQTKHAEAETAFNKAIELWQGDKVPAMNNLALNLAAQGYTDRALDILYKAREKDPNRKEIERNIRIIRTLNEPADKEFPRKPPPPQMKPAA
jgi:Flp pilus assembly protein TadD